MQRSLILAVLASACGDDGFGPPPPSLGSDAIASADGAGPMGVMDAGDATGDSPGPATSASAGDDASTRGPGGEGDTFGATSGATFATDVTRGLGETCDAPGQACEGDGECVVDLRSSQLICSHGRVGEPCVEGSTCQEGLICAIDADGGQFVCVPPV
jgi:hypothetical protein